MISCSVFRIVAMSDWYTLCKQRKRVGRFDVNLCVMYSSKNVTKSSISLLFHIIIYMHKYKYSHI